MQATAFVLINVSMGSARSVYYKLQMLKQVQQGTRSGTDVPRLLRDLLHTLVHVACEHSYSFS